jgi:hypothetical protein
MITNIGCLLACARIRVSSFDLASSVLSLPALLFLFKMQTEESEMWVVDGGHIVEQHDEASCYIIA